MVDSTQQLVRNPPRITVSTSRLRSTKSRLVDANVSSPRLPSITMSCSSGASSSQISAPQVPLTNAFESTTPLRIPYTLSGFPSSPYPGANVIGACSTETPAARAASTSLRVLASIWVSSITPFTASCRAPPSEVKSF